MNIETNKANASASKKREINFLSQKTNLHLSIT